MDIDWYDFIWTLGKPNNEQEVRALINASEEFPARSILIGDLPDEFKEELKKASMLDHHRQTVFLENGELDEDATILIVF